MPREFHGQRSLEGYSPPGPEESVTTESLTLSLQRLEGDASRPLGGAVKGGSGGGDTAKYPFKLPPQPVGSPFICLMGHSPLGDALHGEDDLTLKVIENQQPAACSSMLETLADEVFSLGPKYFEIANILMNDKVKAQTVVDTVGLVSCVPGLASFLSSGGLVQRQSSPAVEGHSLLARGSSTPSHVRKPSWRNAP